MKGGKPRRKKRKKKCLNIERRRKGPAKKKSQPNNLREIEDAHAIPRKINDPNKDLSERRRRRKKKKQTNKEERKWKTRKKVTILSFVRRNRRKQGSYLSEKDCLSFSYDFPYSWIFYCCYYYHHDDDDDYHAHAAHAA
mmetsp:Transcript_5618/g.6216  ORF Transcript_5618/g.6216 Transcript_5618/m.6216 type:complete len:139 (-) Transcript_5618:836-1252(-)